MDEMKNLYRNIAVLTFAAAFLAFGLRAETTSAQTNTTKKPSPTPAKAKKSPTPKTDVKAVATSSPKTAAAAKTSNPPKTNTAKTATKDNKDSQKSTEAKPKPTPATKPKEQKQIIVSATSARVRSEPNLQSATLQYADIGKVFTVSEENESWYQIRLSGNESGWISKTIVSDYSAAQREKIYRQIADKYLQKKSTDFPTAVQIFEFLTRAAKETKSADLSLKRLQMLRYALGSIPFDKKDENPYKNFTETNAEEIVYSEPSGQWYIRAEKIWELHGEYKDKPLGEEIAWEAAQTNLPGECEGYINCYLYLLRVTDGEYLNFYPNGKYSRQALKNITGYLEPIAADAKAKQVYSAANDISDRAEFNRLLAELRTIISKLPFVEKQKAVQQINLIGEAYR